MRCNRFLASCVRIRLKPGAAPGSFYWWESPRAGTTMIEKTAAVPRAAGWLLAAVLAVSQAGGGQARGGFQIVGKVLRSDGKPFTGALPVVFVDGAFAPFALRVYAEKSGDFRIRGLNPGTYNLSVFVPGAGEWRRTIEVGPGTADAKGIVRVEARLAPDFSQDDEHVVSAAELSVPAEAKRLYLKAEQQLGKMDVAGAAASLRKAVEIAPRFAAAWNRLGIIAYQSRKYDEAEELFRKALEQEPGSFPPLVNLGGALLSLGRFGESLEVNLRAARKKPDDPLAQSQLGMSYFMLGEYDRAEAALRHAKTLDPGHFTLPQLLLADIYEHRNNLEGAMLELESFLKLHPDSPRAPEVRARLDGLRKARAGAKPGGTHQK